MKPLDLITVDWPRKITALTCASLIWYSVHIQIHEVEIFRGIPVTLKHPKHLTFIQQELPKIRVTLRGPKKRLQTLTNADIKITGEISDQATSGRYTVLLREKNIEVPGRFEIIEIQPDSFSVTVDTVETIEDVPIRSRFTGNLHQDYGRESYPSPKMAQITGPSKIVRGIPEVFTEAIELDETIHTDFDIEVDLVQIPLVLTTPSSVNVTVELYQKKDTRFFEDLKLSVLNRDDATLTATSYINPAVPKIEVKVVGPKSVVDIITAASIRPFIDISSVTTPGIHTLPVNLWADARDCQAQVIKPMVVEVKIGQ